MTLSPLLLRLVFAALVFGVLFRLYPIAVGQPALSEAFLTEDGYLMLTVARNMAIGLGMSVSDGTIATNGIQPLATYLYTLPYLVTGGDKVTSLVGIHLIMAAIALGGVFAVRALAERLLRDLDVGPLWPWMVAALWFLSPVLLRHSMNGLETGLATAVLALTLVQFWRVIDLGAEATGRDRLILGALCGLAFLARIDAAIFCVMLFGVWFFDSLLRQGLTLGMTLARLIPPGLLSLVVAAPWLLNNQLRFGSIMPISGPAQSLGAEFGAHAFLIPAKVFEYVFPMLPIPRAFEGKPAFITVFGVIVAIVLLWYLIRTLRLGSPASRAVVLALTLHGGALVFYYGFYFGAPHFLSRYLAPVAPLLIVAAMAMALDVGRRLLPRWGEGLSLAYGLGGVVLSAALLIRLLLPGGPEQGHTQVVAWVTENVPERTWVGAVQTGTLGYWHDRTINLDGKVNPEALAARQEFGHVLDYVAASEIDYIADWAGVGNWVKRPQKAFTDAFELIVQDRDINLSVMKRTELRNP